MKHFLVASNFDDGRRYSLGSFAISAVSLELAPTTTQEPERAFKLPCRASADAIVAGLTEFCASLGGPRTWFVVEITEFTSVRSGACPPPASARPARGRGAADPAPPAPSSLDERLQAARDEAKKIRPADLARKITGGGDA